MLERTSPPSPSPAGPVDPSAMLAEWIERHRPLVLTGAGCSTDSGIPDYRAPDGSWKHGKPMTYREFSGSASARRRYWARSAIGWHRIADAQPNPAHRALAALEMAGWVSAVVTQNVDNLHRRAGSQRVVDLHGRLDRVHCPECGVRFRRTQFQRELRRLNPDWRLDEAARRGVARPDGDIDLGAVDYESYQVPACMRCGSDRLKPGVVFFGETIPRRRTQAALGMLADAPGLLVVGSSLTVWSGYRFARETVKAGKPLAILNRGFTRADGEAGLKLDRGCAEVLTAVAERLAGRSASLLPGPG